jgi:hypothetical protein
MSAICYCRNATIKESSQGEKYCDDCGAWWSPKYGSTEPDGKSPRRTKNPIFREKRDPYVKIKELPGRNSGCPCGSGKKWKKCCMNLSGINQYQP